MAYSSSLGPPDDLTGFLRSFSPAQVVAKGAKLFERGAPAAGVYLVEKGEFCVWLTSGTLQRQLLEVVGPGTILGLSETMSGEQYRVTAIAGDGAAAVFVPRDQFLGVLDQHCGLCLEVVRALGEDLHSLYRKFRNITVRPGRPRQRSLQEQLN